MKKVFIGLTVFALAAMVAAPAMATWGWGDDGTNITVTNHKTAIVKNGVYVGAYTGMNSADGGDGGSGGWFTSGGSGGSGGNITSGSAFASARVYNKVNTDITSIDPCPDCDDGDVDDITVENNDFAYVNNDLALPDGGVEANTGLNFVDGGTGGCSGDGGSGGNITSGSAFAGAKIFNRINTIVTRIR